MKIKFAGIMKSMDDLPERQLPDSAERLKEPKSIIILNLITLIAAFPIAHIILEIAGIRMDYETAVKPMLLWGVAAALICILPHEIIHGIAMGGEDIPVYFSPKNLIAFVLLDKAMSKGRFIFVLLAPSLVLGWLPFIIALIFPHLPASGFLAAMGCAGVLVGLGDMIKLTVTAVQVPKNGTVQGSGGYIYWYQ